MCRDCGCSTPTGGTDAASDGRPPENAHAHTHTLAHEHTHEHRTIRLHESLLAKNDHQAAHNRERFQEHGLLAVNLMSSPGSGKTRLLERTLSDLGGRLRLAVVVGDLQTDNDARRLAGRGAPVVPITTGTLCHLEAAMVARACAGIDLAALDFLFIENVGNLVCPASFDLGEEVRVVVLSTTEGEDKPLKYPLAFKTAHAVVINKIDLADAAGFDRRAALANVGAVAPQASVFEVSARTGEGMANWYAYLESLRPAVRSTSAPVFKTRR